MAASLENSVRPPELSDRRLEQMRAHLLEEVDRGMRGRGATMQRLPVKRRTIVVLLGTAVIAMAFAGVALSLGGRSLPVVGPRETAEALREASRKAPGTKEKPLASPHVDGQTWGLRSYRNVRGELCLSHDVPGELTGTGCIAAGKVFARGPLYALPGARQISSGYPSTEWDNMWVYGFAHPDIKTLTVVNIDCSTVDLPLDEDGAFHHVVGREQIRNGQQPYKLVARAGDGAVLAERVVLVGLTHNAKAAGHEAPRPKRACT